MAAPVWATNDVPTATDFNEWLTNIRTVRKTADESVTSSTAFQNDDAFSWSLLATATYEVSGTLLLDAGQTGDWKSDWTGPAGTVVALSWLGNSVGTTGSSSEISQAVQTALADLVNFGGYAAGGGTVRPITIQGHIRTTGTSGTLQLRWAQNTSSATASIIKANSQITLRRVE